MRELSLVVASRVYSPLRCTGFPLWWLLLLCGTGCRCAGSVVVARGLSSCGLQALECRLSSCGARAQLLRGMWDLPGPGLEPVFPALAGGFLTTAPPGKPEGGVLRQDTSRERDSGLPAAPAGERHRNVSQQAEWGLGRLVRRGPCGCPRARVTLPLRA